MSFDRRYISIHSKGERFFNVKCDGCDKVMEPVFPNTEFPDEGSTSLQFEGALHLKALGGYGMFFDYYESTEDFIFCRECAYELIEKFPVFKRLDDD